MSLENFLKWEATTQDTIDVKRIYIDIAGDLVAGILLSQIIFWFLPTKAGGLKTKSFIWREDQRWLVRKREHWWDEVRIGPKQFDRAIRILERKGLIRRRRFRSSDGSPTVSVTLIFDKLIACINSILSKEEDGISPKGKMELDQKESSLLRNETLEENDVENLGAPLPPSDLPSSLPQQIETPPKTRAANEPIPSTLAADIEQGLALFAALLQEAKPYPHPNLVAFLRDHSLEELKLLIEFDRDVLYRESDGTLSHQKKAWITPKTTCKVDHVQTYLPKAQSWAAADKPLEWQRQPRRFPTQPGLSRKTNTNIQNTASWGNEGATTDDV